MRDAGAQDATRWAKTLLTDWRFRNPFGGADLSVMEAIALCGFWRQMIDANRQIHSVMGIAYWKKPTVTPLLWAGVDVPYNRSLSAMPQGTAVALWRSRLKSFTLQYQPSRDRSGKIGRVKRIGKVVSGSSSDLAKHRDIPNNQRKLFLRGFDQR